LGRKYRRTALAGPRRRDKHTIGGNPERGRECAYPLMENRISRFTR